MHGTRWVPDVDGPQEQRVHHREDDDVRRDGHRKRQDCHAREARVAREAADREPEILEELLHKRQPPLVAQPFLRLVHAAEGQGRVPSCLEQAHAGADVVVDVELQVTVQLVGELSFVLPGLEQRSGTARQPS